MAQRESDNLRVGSTRLREVAQIAPSWPILRPSLRLHGDVLNPPSSCQTLVEPWLNESLTTRIHGEGFTGSLGPGCPPALGLGQSSSRIRCLGASSRTTRKPSRSYSRRAPTLTWSTSSSTTH